MLKKTRSNTENKKNEGRRLMLKTYSFLLLLFLISVIIRVPNLNRPLSKHHEFNAALILIPMEVWEQTSIDEHYFSPIMSYQNEGDRGIANMTSNTTEKNGNLFYLSFPAATYVIPYFFFKILGVHPSPLALQVFNMFTHLFCVLLLFQIVLFITSSQLPESKRTIPAIVAATIFLFSPTPLWFYGNGYTHHTLVNVFILWSILITLKILYSNESNRNIKLLFVLTFSILTAWAGYLLAFIICCIFLIRWYKQKKFQPTIVVSITAVLLGSFITYWQYSSIIGGSKFLAYLFDRFFVRSGLDIGFGSSITQLFMGIGKWYIVGYLPILAFLLYQLFNLKINRYQLTREERSFLIISSSLIFSHHFLLSEFTSAHNYSVLIDGILISGIAGILLTKMINNGTSLKRIKFAMLLVFFTSISQYYYINRIGEYSQNGDRYDFMQKIGETIKENSTKEEVIFVMNLEDKPSPQVIYYSKRNFHHVKDRDSANEIMYKSNIKTGKLFVIEKQKVKSIISINN